MDIRALSKTPPVDSFPTLDIGFQPKHVLHRLRNSDSGTGKCSVQVALWSRIWQEHRVAPGTRTCRAFRLQHLSGPHKGTGYEFWLARRPKCRWQSYPRWRVVRIRI